VVAGKLFEAAQNISVVLRGEETRTSQCGGMRPLQLELMRQ